MDPGQMVGEAYLSRITSSESPVKSYQGAPTTATCTQHGPWVKMMRCRATWRAASVNVIVTRKEIMDKASGQTK